MLTDRIKFRHLQCFLAVAQQSSLQKAALSLSISQPAVSKTIKELEELLKVRLFDRGRHGAVLTQQAEVFFAYAEASVNSLHQAAHFLEQNQTVTKPVIRIGAAPAIATSFLPQALQLFRQRVPEIQVSLQTGTTGYLMAQLREREFDFVLCRHCDPEQMAGLSFEFLYADPLVVVVRPGHPLLQSTLPRADARLPFTAILPPKTSINRQAVDTFALTLGLGPVTDFVESLSISFGRTYTTSSNAIWFVPWSAVKHDVETGILVNFSAPMKSRNESTGLMARSTGLMMRTSSALSAEMQIVITAIRECAVARRTEIF
jgi:LysR family transcriptional regulator, pca operon transcriptional activator